MGVDQRFMVNRRIGFILVEYHATVGANDGAGVFQRDQILADGGASGIEVLRQLFDRALSLRLQELENGCLALTWFHRRLSCV